MKRKIGITLETVRRCVGRELCLHFSRCFFFLGWCRAGSCVYFLLSRPQPWWHHFFFSSFPRHFTHRNYQQNEKHSVVASRSRYPGDDESHDGSDRSFRKRDNLGKQLIPSDNHLDSVPRCILEHDLLGQLTAGSQSAVATREYHQKEVIVKLCRANNLQCELIVNMTRLRICEKR